jgi:hypothetical protein
MIMEHWWNDTDEESLSPLRKTRFSATFLNTDIKLDIFEVCFNTAQ